MAANSNPRQNPNVAFRALANGEGGVLLHLDSGEYHGINEIGCVIWRLADGERTETEIVECLRSELVDAPPELHDEVRGFLDDLRQRNLIVN